MVAPLNVVVVAGGIGLTGLFVGGILWGSPEGRSGRRLSGLVAAVVVGWAALSFVLGASGAYAAHADRFDAWILLGLAVPLLLGVLAFSTAAPLRRLAAALPLPWLIGIQVYRVFGVTFLIAAGQGRMPYEFALAAGLGDMAIGILAPLVALWLARDGRGSHALAVVWNLAGIADLVVAVTLGVLTSPSIVQVLAPGHANAAITRFPFVLIPVFAVPASLLLHGLALWRLATSRRPAPTVRSGYEERQLRAAHGSH